MPPPTISDSDVYKFVVDDGNGIKGLVDTCLESVPHQYIQPPDARFDFTKSTALDLDSIPIIDVLNWEDSEKVADSICEAASKWGFFQITNHGLSLELLDGLIDAARSFFEQPLEEKRRVLKDDPSGSVRLGTSFTPRTEEVLEWKDYLSMSCVAEDDDEASSNLFWPSVCKDKGLEYVKQAKMVVRKLMKVLLKGLNVEKIDEANEDALMGATRINFNYYPPCPNPELTAGVGPHADISTITVLLQDNVGGLYVRGSEPESEHRWIPVQPVTGALIINIGDVLQIMSNGLYKSVEHRAITNRRRSRVSIPIFVNPLDHSVIAPVPEALKNGDKPKYKPVVFSDYFNYFFSKPHDGKKTIEFSMI